MGIIDAFLVIKSIEFLDKYETDAKRREAMNKIQSEAFSSFAFKSRCLIGAFLLILFLKCFV